MITACETSVPARCGLGQQAALAKPAHGVVEGKSRRPPLVSKLACRFRAGKKHVLTRHAHAFQRNPAAAACDSRDRLRNVSDGQHGRIRQADAGRLAAGELRDVAQYLLQRQVLAAENVAFAGAAVMKSHQVARCNVIDVHDIESGVDVRRHTAGSGVEHQLTGRCRLHVARPHRCRWVDDDGRRPGGRGLEYQALGKKFRAFVMTDHRRERDGRALIAGRTIRRYAHGRNAAGVDDLFDPRVGGSGQQIAGSLDVREIELRGIRSAQPIVRRNMEKNGAVAQCAVQRRRDRQITHGDFERQVLQVGAVRCRANQSANLPAGLHQCSRNGRADETGGTGYQRSHAIRDGDPAANASGASAPVRATATKAREAVRYRCASRSSGAMSLGDRAIPRMSREMCTVPSRLAAKTAAGSVSLAVSTITRTAIKGRPCVAAIFATPKLSISTAAAPVSLNAAALPAESLMISAVVSSLPLTTVCGAAIAAINSSRQCGSVAKVAPSRETTALGRQIVPAGSAGSRPPAIPQLTNAVAPASTSARAAIAAAVEPMPLTATRVPSLIVNRPPLRRIGAPKVRASALSAATTPVKSLSECSTWPRPWQISPQARRSRRDSNRLLRSMRDSAARKRAKCCKRPQRKITAIAV